MARFGHLADGRLKLVLVRRCNALQYLGFLLSMSRTGVSTRERGLTWLRMITQLLRAAWSYSCVHCLECFVAAGEARVKPVTKVKCCNDAATGWIAGVFPGQHPYVDVIDAVAVRVECQGQQSHWNLDGELLSTQCLSAEVHQGLVKVFARGVER